MPILVHHRPIDSTRKYQLHAWTKAGANLVRDVQGTTSGSTIDFNLAGVNQPRNLALQYHWETASTAQDTWEAQDYIRLVRRNASEIWTFEYSARIVYAEPGAPTTASEITLHAITQNRFSGGFIYAWNPYGDSSSELFPQSSRDDSSATSTFTVPIRPWMAGGFHFKLVSADQQNWEPNASTRVWVPSDGTEAWIKSGQVSLRRTPLKPRSITFQVMVPVMATVTPVLELLDPVEGATLSLVSISSTSATDPLFRMLGYVATIYPGAAYRLHPVDNNQGESPAVDRPFPGDPEQLSSSNILLLGNAEWLNTQPVTRPISLRLTSDTSSVFGGATQVSMSVGNGPAYQTATPTASGANWQLTANVFSGIRHAIRWSGSALESKLNLGIDTTRYLTPDASSASYFTAEGVFGFTGAGPVKFADLSGVERNALMSDAFGAEVVSAGTFDASELPHGATFSGTDVVFVLFAPHAARAAVVFLDVVANARRRIEMSLTADRKYWWCRVPAASAPHGTQYRFALNDNREVLDPASRGIVDSGNFNTTPADDPAKPDTSWSWSRVIDPANTTNVVKAVPWTTLGWGSLLIYELHPERFTNRNVAGAGGQPLAAFDQIAAESASGGYLNKLGITAIELLPIHEFASTNSWGYNPAFYFAPECFYGGPEGLARCVAACHRNGMGVLLDVVYNHTNDTPFNTIAPEVYISGEAYGGLKINFANPMVKEFLRQAHVYMWTAFRVDGFRFDDTKTMVENGGWDLLAALTGAIRKAATALGEPWPYQVAENDPNYWDLTNPALGVMDGQWQINEISNLGRSAYDPWQSSDNHAWDVRSEMVLPESMMRPYYQAVRAAETHDSCGHPDDGGQTRIAARPPFRQGLQMAKAMGTAVILSNGIPMFFMGAEYGETRPFSMNNSGDVLNPQTFGVGGNDSGRVMAWFRSLIGLRKDPSKQFGGDDNQGVAVGHRTVAFTRGWNQRIWTCFTFGTANQHPSAGSLGLPDGRYKEIFNSSWPVFQVEFEQEQTNGGYTAGIYPGSTLNLPFIGAVVLERA